jgi:hypothetical protein
MDELKKILSRSTSKNYKLMQVKLIKLKTKSMKID